MCLYKPLQISTVLLKCCTTSFGTAGWTSCTAGKHNKKTLAGTELVAQEVPWGPVGFNIWQNTYVQELSEEWQPRVLIIACRSEKPACGCVVSWSRCISAGLWQAYNTRCKWFNLMICTKTVAFLWEAAGIHRETALLCCQIKVGTYVKYPTWSRSVILAHFTSTLPIVMAFKAPSCPVSDSWIWRKGICRILYTRHIYLTVRKHFHRFKMESVCTASNFTHLCILILCI